MISIDKAGTKRTNKRICILILLQMVVLLTVLLFCDIKYEVSDDFVMQLLSAGSFTGKPDAHLIFCSCLWGKLLVFLYNTYAGINWYFWGLIGVGFLSCCGVSCILGRKMNLRAGIICTCIFALFIKDLYVMPQFTKTAAAAFASGGTLFLCEVFSFQKRSKGCLALSVILIVSGCFLRHNAFYIAGGALLILIVFLFWNQPKKSRKGLAGILAACLGILVVVFTLRGINHSLYYEDEEYRYFMEYSYVRAYIVDYPCPDYEECREELEEIDVSETDYQMILEWSFADKQVFSLEKMQEILHIIERHRPRPFKNPAAVILRMAGRGVYKYPGTIACVLLSVGIFLLWKRKTDVSGDKSSFLRECGLPFAAGIMTLSVMGILVYRGHGVYRVEYGLLFSAAVILLFPLSSLLERSDRQFPFERVCEGVAFLVIIVLAFRLHPDHSWETMTDQEYRDYINGIFDFSLVYNAHKYSNMVNARQMSPAFLAEVNDHPENLYLLDFNTTIQSLYYNFSPLSPVEKDVFDNMIYLGGVTVNHPVTGDFLEKWNIQEPLPGLLKERVYLVSNGNSGLFLAYLQEHYSKDATVELVKELDGYQIWKYTERREDAM